MCNRYLSPGESTIERYWHLGRVSQWPRSLAVFPRKNGPFLRPIDSGLGLVVGQWGLIPWFAKTATPKYATNNARFEEIAQKASFKESWAKGRRCIIPALSFDEPCWETGNNVWWRLRRTDGAPWGLAGLWSAWTDQTTGEVIESYTMLTVNADAHPLMSRMHRPDPKLLPHQQDKRSVVSIDFDDVHSWLYGSVEEAAQLIAPMPIDVIKAEPLL